MTKEMEKNGLMGERLLKLRNQNGLTQEGLAERLDVSRQSISKWELNKTLPDVDKLIQLSEMYQVSIDYLVTGKESEGRVSEQEEENRTETADHEIMHAVDAGKRDAEFMMKPVILTVCIAISGVLFVCMAFLSGKFLVNNLLNRKDKKQQLVCVEKIHEQYTKADVIDDNLQRQMVWLDISGVREGDFIFSYVDEENPGHLFFEYYSKTLILPIIFGIVFLIFFIVFLMEWSIRYRIWRQERKLRDGERE